MRPVELSLGEIVELNKSTISSDYGIVKYLDTGSVTRGQINNVSVLDPKVDKIPSRARRLVKTNSIIYSTVRPVQRHYCYITEEYSDSVVSTGFVVIDACEDIVDSKYLYYWLTQTEIVNLLQSIGETGVSTYPSVKPSDIANLKISLPSLREQRNIAGLLSSLDAKIENNLKINVILEELAQTLFKRWFVDFEFPNDDGKPYKSSGGKMKDSEVGMIPEGWDVTSLDDVTSKVATGLNPRKNFVLGEGKNYYVTIKNMSNNNVVLDSKCDKITDEAIDIINKRSDLKKGDLLISGIGTIGRVHLIFEKPNCWNISESVFTIRSNDVVSEFFLYVLLLNTPFQEYATSNAVGSVQKGLRMKDLKEYTFALPPKDKMSLIEEIFCSLISQVKSNDIENRKLSKLRDTLLPKLMSGEIRVPIDID